MNLLDQSLGQTARDSRAEELSDADWSKSTNEALVEHILSRYHDVHREQLPELIRLSQRVERVHGNHPESPAGLADLLARLQGELESHMQKEEQILFPMIVRGVSGMAVQPVAMMRREHDEHTLALAAIDQLTNNLCLPERACNTWQKLYHGLESFKADLVRHVELENRFLFARIDAEQEGQNQGMRHG